jgi:hypothetical protein
MLRGDDGEASDVLEFRSRVLPLFGVSESSLRSSTFGFGLLGTFFILVVALVTQMTLRQVEWWN